MKRMIKNAAFALLWVMLSLCALWYVNRVLVMKNRDGVLPMQSFYEQKKGTVDVLVLGSSHAGTNLDTSTLWSEYGMASYFLWGGHSPFWNSYYYLIEALKTQTPKAVVLETYAATFMGSSDYDRGQVINTVGMRASLNKWEAVKTSFSRDHWLDVFFGFPIYHERFYELTQEDYMHFPWTEGMINHKGCAVLYGSQRFVGLTDVSDITQTAELDEKEEEYLRRIIALCQEREIPILLIKTPVRGDWQRDQQPYYNRVAQIAQEYGIPFYNLNSMWKELGFSREDFAIDNQHLNINGARKATMYLGQELQALCDIPDRRGDPRYASWDENARRIQFPELSSFFDTQSYLEELKRRDWMVFVATQGKADAAQDLLSVLNVPEFPQESAGAWLLPNTQSGEWIEASQNDRQFIASANGIDVMAQISGWTWFAANGYEVSDGQDSDVLIGVIDAKTGRCVDAIRLSADSPRFLERLM